MLTLKFSRFVLAMSPSSKAVVVMWLADSIFTLRSSSAVSVSLKKGRWQYVNPLKNHISLSVGSIGVEALEKLISGSKLLSWYVQHTNPALSLYWFQAVNNCVVSRVSRVKNPRVLPSLTCSQDACGANAQRLGRWRTQCCPRWTCRTTVASAMPRVAAPRWM